MCITEPLMLDTNVFNHALDGKFSISRFAGRRLLVTGIQKAELGATKNNKRRAALLGIFAQIDPAVELAESFAFDVEGAGWDQAKWNDGSGAVEKMLARLQQLDQKKRKKSGDPLNPLRDILIAETAIKNGAILVSGDNNLRQVMSEFGGKAMP
jgi:predicted nucleic acid-binding protein